MKTLVVYYSRTGTTKKAGDAIASKLRCDTLELFDTTNWKGPIGYLRAGRDASKKKLSKLKPIDKDIESYDLVLVGTPVWAWDVSVPVRTFLQNNRDKLGKVAFFVTMGGNPGKTFESMKQECGKEPVATLLLTTKEVAGNQHTEKIAGFVKELK